jgi:hypothetical protein
MHPEDRVLIGVINRVADLRIARDQGWYRIPCHRAPPRLEVEHADYLAFYLSRAFGVQNSGIHFYARRMGHELARRRDLIPTEPDHPRADVLYYKVQLGHLQAKSPPILNPARRPVAFICTTWDRFMAARTIADLYSTAPGFTERTIT